MSPSPQPFARPIGLVFLLAGLALAVLIRLALFDFVTADFIFSISRWMRQAVASGPWQFIGLEDVSDYNPPYLYLLSLGTLLPLSHLHAVKLISILFDFAAAGLVFGIARQRFAHWRVAVLAGLLFLFAPTVIVNGALWGQCDIIPACFVFLTMHALLREKMALAGVAYGLALAFKLQAIFFAPVLLVLILQGRFRWRDVGCGILTYLALLLPAILAGRGLANTLTIYLRQAGSYPELTLGTANIYTWVVQSKDNYPLLKSAGLCLGAFLALLSVYLIYQAGKKLTGSLLVAASLYFCLLLPFVLPGMHERYFFLADAVAVLYAVYYPGRVWVPLLMGIFSYAMYGSFIYRLVIIPLPLLACLVGGLLFYVAKKLWEELYPAGVRVRLRDGQANG